MSRPYGELGLMLGLLKAEVLRWRVGSPFGGSYVQALFVGYKWCIMVGISFGGMGSHIWGLKVGILYLGSWSHISSLNIEVLCLRSGSHFFGLMCRSCMGS